MSIIYHFSRFHQSFSLLLCLSLWDKHGGHPIGFLTGIYLWLWLVEAAQLIGSPEPSTVPNPITDYRQSTWPFTVASMTDLRSQHSQTVEKCPQPSFLTTWYRPMNRSPFFTGWYPPTHHTHTHSVLNMILPDEQVSVLHRVISTYTTHTLCSEHDITWWTSGSHSSHLHTQFYPHGTPQWTGVVSLLSNTSTQYTVLTTWYHPKNRSPFLIVWYQPHTPRSEHGTTQWTGPHSSQVTTHSVLNMVLPNEQVSILHRVIDTHIHNTFSSEHGTAYWTCLLSSQHTSGLDIKDCLTAWGRWTQLLGNLSSWWIVCTWRGGGIYKLLWVAGRLICTCNCTLKLLSLKFSHIHMYLLSNCCH